MAAAFVDLGDYPVKKLRHTVYFTTLAEPSKREKM